VGGGQDADLVGAGRRTTGWVGVGWAADGMRGKLSKDCVGGRLEAVGLDAVYSAKVIFALGGLDAAGFVRGGLNAVGSTPLASAIRDAK
jgi:hypothetical protein